MFNDWDSVKILLRELDSGLTAAPAPVHVIIIDDGSTDPIPPGFTTPPFQSLGRVELLRLRRNLGHQRAIAVGLVFVYQHRPCDAVIVMDADGEDRPADVAILLRELQAGHSGAIVFAARGKRLENFAFRALYHV